ncbi:MAG: hypothetical protein CMJ76_14130 [Planctomycetaceae bacterium]|nr:hypothetical protein [Planctomycetaceae bacterium]|tara:strand:+ start:87 stop:1574 length:1488 start_codon:yes stop_codon:yes gene_type:complete
MSADNQQKILVVGGGFSGSILAVILQKHGYSVTLIDRSIHPRFAIGESSTPTAGLILRTLIERYSMPELKPFTRYGLWNDLLPDVGVGVKRGFSYFFHSPGVGARTTVTHDSELLVAASSSRIMADTHWYRQDVDSFLLDYAVSQGVVCRSSCEITDADYDPLKRIWQVQLSTTVHGEQFDWIIDASGAGEVMCQLVGDELTQRPDLETNTSAIYGHFQNVKQYDTLLKHAGMDLSDFPFSSDDAAQHHIFTSQWLWSLRFDNGVTSLGLVSDLNRPALQSDWSDMLAMYPAIRDMLKDAELDSATPLLHTTDRLQRLSVQGSGPGWVALPNTIGFIDPLHSTGIAHSLSGVERLAEIFTRVEVCQEALGRYADAVYAEFRLIDQMIAGCYKLMPSKRHFEAYCMLYFTAAHNYETRRINLPTNACAPGIFLSDDLQMVELIEQGYRLANQIAKTEQWEAPELFEQKIRELIRPFDQIGLCNPATHSMYSYTAVF